jgi:hypothetical protein
MVDHLPSKYKALSLNPIPPLPNKNKKQQQQNYLSQGSSFGARISELPVSEHNAYGPYPLGI